LQIPERKQGRLPDIVNRETRSRMMSGIKGKDTKPEILLRTGLHRLGFRYRLHARNLPGQPDIVLAKWRAIIFVHGCFWHGHDCHLFKMPSTRTEFWRNKIAGNAQRDSKAIWQLANDGWRIGTIWECALKGRTRRQLKDVLRQTKHWLKHGSGNLVISGTE